MSQSLLTSGQLSQGNVHVILGVNNPVAIPSYIRSIKSSKSPMENLGARRKSQSLLTSGQLSRVKWFIKLKSTQQVAIPSYIRSIKSHYRNTYARIWISCRNPFLHQVN